MTSKTCTKCHAEKPMEDFYYRKKRSVYEASCKRCMIEAIEACRIKREVTAGEDYHNGKLERHRISNRKYQRTTQGSSIASQRGKRATDSMSSGYIISLLKAETDVPIEDLKKMDGIQEIIETKRIALRIKRHIKQQEF